jgi:hypothetical protein
MTTPLTFIFWPLTTVREFPELLVVAVWGCDIAIEADTSSAPIANVVEATVLILLNTIEFVSFEIS